jgi:hypothetical protein
MVLPASYEAGKLAALEQYGLHRRMPEGPSHLGAERLARALTQQSETHASRFSAASKRRGNNLENPVRWGEKSPIDSGSASTQGGSGIGLFGGV